MVESVHPSIQCLWKKKIVTFSLHTCNMQQLILLTNVKFLPSGILLILFNIILANQPLLTESQIPESVILPEYCQRVCAVYS